jgi:hypothetical protein
MDKVTKGQGAVRKSSNFIKDWSDVISNLDIPKRPARLSAASKPKEKGNLGCIDSPYESLPSAKAAPGLKDAIELLRNYSLPGDRNAHISANSFFKAVSILEALEAQPAAERTALLEFREKVKMRIDEEITTQTALKDFNKKEIPHLKIHVWNEGVIDGLAIAKRIFKEEIDAQESEDK